MNRRERLKRAFFHDEMDRPAVFSRTGFPANDPTYDRLKAYLAEYTERKAGWRPSSFETPLPIETRREPLDGEYDRSVHVLHTPAGDLTRTERISRTGLPGLHETYFLKSRDDAESYLSLPPPLLQGDPAPSFAETDALIGDSGIVDVNLGFCCAGGVAELFGSEQFAMLTMTDRDILHALAEQYQQTLFARLQFCLDHDIGPFFSMAGEEYLVPPLHGPEDFRDFVVRYDRPIIERIHDAGGRLHIHCHGPLRDVLADFVDVGVDVLHPVESPPLGNLTAAQAKSIVRDHVTIEGNIQIARLYEAGAAEIAEETKCLIADAFDDGRGLIVSPTASPWIRGAGEQCYAQYRAMIDTVIKF